MSFAYILSFAVFDGGPCTLLTTSHGRRLSSEPIPTCGPEYLPSLPTLVYQFLMKVENYEEIRLLDLVVTFVILLFLFRRNVWLINYFAYQFN